MTIPAEEEKKFGNEIWIVLGVYLVFLVIVLAYSGWQRRKQAAKDGNTTGALVDHYLAGRNLGPVVLGFSVCASMFSGYTVVGLPAEAYQKGFSAWRWVGSSTFVTVVYVSYAPRLQWLARERGYDSILSFVRDRYGIVDQRLDPLHWLMVLVVLCPCFIYLCAQFDAFGNTLSSLSDGAVTPLAGALGLAGVLAIYEMIGGLHAVALTDVIQGGVLLFGSLMILVYMDTRFGSLPAMTRALEDTNPGHVNVMDYDAGLSWAEFWIGVGLQRALFPDYPQRAMAARSQSSLRLGSAILAISPFLIQVPLLFFGIIGAVHHPGEAKPKKVFSLVVLDIIYQDTTGKVIGYLMMGASVAAIMSTADSVLIVVSYIVTLDVFRPFQETSVKKAGDFHGSVIGGDSQLVDSDLEPEKRALIVRRQRRVVYFSRIVTICAAFACIPIVQSDFDLSFLIQFQSSILAQTAPTSILALYWKGMHRWSSMAGLVVGVASGVYLVWNEFEGGILISLAGNIVVTLFTAAVLPSAAKAKNQQHEDLLQLISWRPPKVTAEGKQLRYRPCVKEPVSHRCYLFLLALVLPWFALPFYRTPNVPDHYLSGSPMWAVTSVVVLLFEHALLIYLIAFCWTDHEDDDGTIKAPPEPEPKKEEEEELATTQKELESLRKENADFRRRIELMSRTEVI